MQHHRRISSKRHSAFRFTRAAALATLIALASAGTALAGPIMYVHDTNENFGTVDAATGQTQVIGNLGSLMEDIAFDAAGNLFGLTHSSFYSIDPATGQATRIGAHGVPGANALVFSDTGTLYAAGYDSRDLYTIDPMTGTSSDLGSTGFKSAGDLAFHDGGFFLASYDDQLVQLDLGDLSNSASVGAFGVEDIYGLASGDDGLFYGVSGTRLYRIDSSNGAAFDPVDFGGQGFSQVLGQAFYTEAGADPQDVPAPSMVWLGALALLGMGAAAARRRRHG